MVLSAAADCWSAAGVCVTLVTATKLCPAYPSTSEKTSKENTTPQALQNKRDMTEVL